jgi:hypothetical protein
MSDWWSRKLGSEQQSSSTPPVRTPAPRRYTPPVDQPGYKQQVAYDAENDYVTTKAQHQRSESTCPECGSGNYIKVGTASGMNGSFAVQRCYDCGYPAIQTTSGISGKGDPGASSHKAEQVQSGGYNPTTIVGRVDG